MKSIRQRALRSKLRAAYRACLLSLGMVALSVCIPARVAVAAVIGVHEYAVDGVSVSLTPDPQPDLVGDGTQAAPLLFDMATLDSITSASGGAYTTPDGIFTISGTVQAANDNGQVASLVMMVTAIDNKPVLDGQLGGDILEVILRQDYVLSGGRIGLAQAVINGTCNQAAQDANSTVDVGVNLTPIVLPALTGSCAPLGQFFASSASVVPIDQDFFTQGDMFFHFREGPAGQAITVPLIVTVPEPSTLLLSAFGVIGMLAFVRRRRTQSN